MSQSLDATYWDSRYQEHRLGWDIGEVSTPLRTYLDQLEDRSIKILIPGGGNAYEAEYAFKQGFENTFVVDLAATAKDNFLKRFPEFPEEQFLVQDFFTLQGQWDLILEQTFFCALDPSLRPAYGEKMKELLAGGGTLAGVLFTFPLKSGPPFGGSKEEYQGYFSEPLQVKIIEPCYNSIPPRMGSELFFKVTNQ